MPGKTLVWQLICWNHLMVLMFGRLLGVKACVNSRQHRLWQILDAPNNDTATRKAAQQLLAYFAHHKRIKNLETQLQAFFLSPQ